MLNYYPFLCFFIPNVVWQIINLKKLKNKNKIRHIIWTYIFMFYVYLAVYDAAGIGTVWDLLGYGGIDHTINLIPFSSEGCMTYILNIIMFMPLGFLLPLIWADYRKLKKTVFVGIGLSFTIEFCQLFCLRATDIDDLTMNTLGTAFGFVIWIVFHKIFSKSGEKAAAICKREPLYYIWIGILGIVLLYNWRWIY